MMYQDNKHEPMGERLIKPSFIKEICLAFSISFLFTFFTLKAAGIKQCISYDASQFIGKWIAVKPSGGIQTLVFNPDSSVFLSFGADSISVHYDVINNNLQLVDKNGNVSNTGIISLNNDTVALLDLYGNGVLAKYTKLPDEGHQAMTGIQVQSGNINNISVYPNPFSSGFTISLPDNPASVFLIQVTDLNGKILVKKQTDGATLIEIDAINWPQGAYLVNITGANGEKNFAKLIKVKY